MISTHGDMISTHRHVAVPSHLPARAERIERELERAAIGELHAITRGNSPRESAEIHSPREFAEIHSPRSIRRDQFAGINSPRSRLYASSIIFGSAIKDPARHRIHPAWICDAESYVPTSASSSRSSLYNGCAGGARCDEILLRRDSNVERWARKDSNVERSRRFITAIAP